MSITDLLQPIKDRLEAATPGPWFAHQEYIDMGVPDAQHTITDSPNRYDGKFIAAVGLHSDVKHANSDLIRYAPTDQARLIAAVEAVEALAEYWESTPALRNGPAAKDLRAALTSALESAA